jgi:hypothetical protein
LSVILAASAHAYEPGTTRAANTLAMGFTGVAAPSDNVGITMNPALLAMRDRYDFDGQFAYGAHPHVGWGGSIVDSRTNDVAFGIGYRRLSANPPFEVDELPGWSPPNARPTNLKRFHEVTGGVAIPTLGRHFTFGVNGTLSISNHERQGKGTSGNMDVGIAVEPAHGLIFGVNAHELVPVNDGLDHPFGIAAGIRVEEDTIGALEFNADYLLEDKTRSGPLEMGAGGEAALATARVRAGWASRDNRHWVTSGIGAQNEAGAVEYGIAIPTDMTKAAEMMHMVSLRILAPQR